MRLLSHEFGYIICKQVNLVPRSPYPDINEEFSVYMKNKSRPFKINLLLFNTIAFQTPTLHLAPPFRPGKDTTLWWHRYDAHSTRARTWAESLAAGVVRGGCSVD